MLRLRRYRRIGVGSRSISRGRLFRLPWCMMGLCCGGAWMGGLRDWKDCLGERGWRGRFWRFILLLGCFCWVGVWWLVNGCIFRSHERNSSSGGRYIFFERRVKNGEWMRETEIFWLRIEIEIFLINALDCACASSRRTRSVDFDVWYCCDRVLLAYDYFSLFSPLLLPLPISSFNHLSIQSCSCSSVFTSLLHLVIAIAIDINSSFYTFHDRLSLPFSLHIHIADNPPSTSRNILLQSTNGFPFLCKSNIPTISVRFFFLYLWIPNLGMPCYFIFIFFRSRFSASRAIR